MKYPVWLMMVYWVGMMIFTACGSDSNNQVPRFEKTNCKFPLHVTQKQGSTVTCGDLVVWENRSEQKSRTIRLHVARFHGQDSHASPLVYLIGGPGGSAKEMSAYVSTAFVDAIANPGDFIIFDQRGVGKSNPFLYCNELDQSLQELEPDSTPAEQKTVMLAALKDCRDRLISSEVDLGAYNSVENAVDVDELRTVLGYDTINLWGGSYGSRLALEILRNHADGLRSAVIEAIAPPQAAWSFEIGKNFEDSLSRLFDACHNDTACFEKYQDLDTKLEKTYTDLNAEPLTFPPYSDKLTGYKLLSILFNFMYVSDTFPYLPKLVQAAHDRKADEVLDILDRFKWILEGADLYWGMHVSVVCQDHVRYMQPEDLTQAFQNVRPAIKDVFLPYAETFVEICKDWPMAASNPKIMDPVVSGIPTLIFNGEFDPITPGRYGEMVVTTLTKGQMFDFPNTGHGTNSECAFNLMTQFLADPGAKADGSCIQDLDPLIFEDPAPYGSNNIRRPDLLPHRLIFR